MIRDIWNKKICCSIERSHFGASCCGERTMLCMPNSHVASVRGKQFADDHVVFTS